METLATTHIGQIYYIDKIVGKDQGKLRELGLITDREISLL